MKLLLSLVLIHLQDLGNDWILVTGDHEDFPGLSDFLSDIHMKIKKIFPESEEILEYLSLEKSSSDNIVKSTIKPTHKDIRERQERVRKSRMVDGLTYLEIAEREDVSVSTVRNDLIALGIIGKKATTQ